MDKKVIFLFLLFDIVFSAPSCRENENFCKKCNVLTNLCLQCMYDKLKPDEKGGCEPAKVCEPGKNYCEECDKDSSICKTCTSFYFPDEVGGCSYTTNCNFSLKGICKKCNENFLLIGNSTLGLIFCKDEDSEDFINCKTIDYQTGLCKECEENYFLNSGDKKCIEKENCKESLYGKCISCSDGYYLDFKDGNKCKPEEEDFRHCIETEDGKICSKCEEGYYFDDEQKCVNTNYCSQSKNFVCTKCKKNYYFSEAPIYCVSTKNCIIGDRDSGACLSCSPLFYLDINDERKCKSNQEEDDLKNCKMFKDECLSCENNFYLGLDSLCSTTKNCAKSEINVCNECATNYTLTEEKQCTLTKHCIHVDNYEKCVECEDGFYFNSFINLCIETKDQFENCKVTSGGLKCDECKDDYYLNMGGDGYCYPNDKEGPLYKCAIAIKNETECLRCTKNYYLGTKDGKCSKINYCSVSKNNECIECDADYCLDVKKGTCEYNDYIEEEEDMFYYKCNKTDEEGTKCKECINGFALNEKGLCTDPSKCKEEKEGECIKCIDSDQDPIYKIDYCLNSNFGCVETYSNKNCQRCDSIDFDNCTECIKGYELVESSMYEGYSECKQME